MAKYRCVGALLVSAGALMGTTGGQAGTIFAPSFSKAFGTPSVPLNGSTSLTLSIANANANAATVFNNIAFTDNLPAGLVVSTPNGLINGCGGTVVALDGSTTVELTNGTLVANANCSVAVNVTGTTSGTKVSTTTALSSSRGSAFSATATLTVLAAAVAAASIPTLSEWGLILLVLAMAVSAFKAVRRQR